MEAMSESLLQKLSILRGAPPTSAEASTAAPSALTPEEVMKQLTPEDMEELQRVYEEISGKMVDSEGGDGDLPERKLELPGGRTLGSDGVRRKAKGVVITPVAGFVFKCKRLGKPTGGTAAGSEGGAARLMASPPDFLKTNGECKVFVNVCQSDLLALPGIKKRLDENGEEVEGMNIPMSVGSPRVGQDSRGEPCVVYDIIVHNNVVAEALADRTGKHRDFVCQVSIVSLEQKYGEHLDRRYKLPKLRAMGELAPQQIRDVRQEPQIAEVGTQGSASAAAAAAAAAQAAKAKQAAKLAAELAAPEMELRCAVSYVVLKGELPGSCRDEELLARVVNAVNGRDSQIELRDIPSTVRLQEYTEPLASLAVPGGSVVALLVTCVVARETVADVGALDVQLSPYRVAVKVPRYKAAGVHFPLVLQPAHCCSYVRALADRSNLEEVELHVLCLADRAAWSAAPDVGSKAWLVAQALNDYSGDGGIYSSSSSSSSKESSGAAAAAHAVPPSPEDVFHVRPAASSAAARAPDLEDMDNIELPEDRFHSKDAASSYIISQRDEATKSRKDKAAKDRAERVNDPSVEYIDVEDFAPGGKYAPAGSAPAGSAAAGELSRASYVLQQSVAEKEEVGELASSAWAELL